MFPANCDFFGLLNYEKSPKAGSAVAAGSHFKIDANHGTHALIKKGILLPFSIHWKLIQFKTHQHNLLSPWELNRISRFPRKRSWTVWKSRKLVYWHATSVMCKGRILGSCVMLADVIVDRRCCLRNLWLIEHETEQTEAVNDFPTTLLNNEITNRVTHSAQNF